MMEYSTSDDTSETTFHKPRGMVRGALRPMVHILVDAGRDGTVCGRWSYLSYATKEGNQVLLVSTYRVCNQTKPGYLTASKQQLGVMYEDEELRPFLVDPHKKTIIDLKCFMVDLKLKGCAFLVLTDANQLE
jgi:hypothetical protein